MPFRHRRRRAGSEPTPEEQIIGPLATLEEHLMIASTDLDDLAAKLGGVAALIRDAAAQAAGKTAGRCDG